MITNKQNITFCGYDARPLKGIITCDNALGKNIYSLSDEISHILNKENVDVFILTKNTVLKNDFKNKTLSPVTIAPWSQDKLTFLPDKKFICNFPNFIENVSDRISEFFSITKLNTSTHIDGGNYFFTKNKQKENVVLLGNEELQMNTFPKIKEYFGKTKICTITQPDYHLDLSIRPLNNGNVLVNDNALLLEKLRIGIENCKKATEKDKSTQLAKVLNNLEQLYHDIQITDKSFDLKNKHKKLIQELKYNKFNVIRVPAFVIHLPKEKPENIFDLMASNIPKELSSLAYNIEYRYNYLNAIVHERPNNSLVYITGKSMLDSELGITEEIAKKIDFSFEKIFKDSLKDYIADEDIHFVGDKFCSELLEKLFGGVHCIFSEIPKFREPK